MNEFIFTWSIENISYSWHENQRQITGPPFVADTLQNTVWTLTLYPRGNVPRGERIFGDFLSLYLIRGEDGGPSDFLFNCEFSCVSAKNLTLKSVRPKRLESTPGMGSPVFLRRHEVFVLRKALYLPQDTLTLRCRMWKCEGDIDKFGQCFGRTRLEIERVLSVQGMNPRVTRKKSIDIHSKSQNELLIFVHIVHEEDGLDIYIANINYKLIKSFSVKFSVVLKNRKVIDYIDYWLDRPPAVRMKLPFSNTGSKTSARNKLKLTCELIYSTGVETNSIEKINPCSFKFPEFSSKCILSFIPSGKLSDCPSVGKDLWDLCVKHILCDVELKTQTASFWVHQTVLCARSPVFLTMFTVEMKEKTSKCVEIEDLVNDTLGKFLSFLYTDNFEESQWNAVAELYYAADKYQVENLKSFCCYYFTNNIDVLNVCDLLMLADRHSDAHLKSKIEDYIVSNHECVFTSTTWEQFSDKQPLLAERTMLCIYDEERRDDTFGKRYMLSSCPSALEDFRTLYQSQILSDIVIQATSVTFPAHKIMLCAGSSKLRKLLASGKSTVSLEMENLEVDTVSRLLLFLYTDSLGDINWETATKLYHAAIAYQIERLKIKCSCFFLENLKASNVANVLILANKHRDIRLRSLVIKDLIFRRYKKIIASKHWAKIIDTDPPKRIETRLSKRLRLENKS